MKNIDPAVLTQLIVAISALITAIAGVLKSWSNGKKVDENTTITKAIAEKTPTTVVIDATKTDPPKSDPKP